MSIGVWQVVLILVIVLIIFGAGKLPKVMGDLAKGVKTFRSGLKDEEEGEGKSGDAGAAIGQNKSSSARSSTKAGTNKNGASKS
ncbi:MAG: twin-arginine translocase TatA/TatE family subunit [Pseudomonadota bacterium]